MIPERGPSWPHASYDVASDAIGIYFVPEGAEPRDSAQVAPGVRLHYDQRHRVVGVEILHVRDLLTTGRTHPPFRDCLPPYENDTPDPFQHSLARYNAEFPDQGLPFLLGVWPEDQPVAIALLRWAVARKRPLGRWQIMAALGIEEPPAGVVI